MPTTNIIFIWLAILRICNTAYYIDFFERMKHVLNTRLNKEDKDETDYSVGGHPHSFRDSAEGEVLYGSMLFSS